MATATDNAIITNNDNNLMLDTATSISQQEILLNENESSATTSSDHAFEDAREEPASQIDASLDVRTITSFPSSIVTYELPPLKPLPGDYEQVAVFLTTAVNTRHNHSDPTKRPNHSSGNGYKALLECLRQPPSQVDLPLLYKVLRALQGGQILATLFSKPQLHPLLIHSIFRLNVLHLVDVRRMGSSTNNEIKEEESMYEDIVNCYYHLLVAICSANTTFLVPVFTAIIKLMRYALSKEVDGVVPSLEYDSSKSLKTSESLKVQSKIDRLHATLQKILLLIPKSKSELYSIIAMQYPHVTQSSTIVKNYLILVFQMWEYCDFIREELILLVLKKSLEMDVEILIKDNGTAIIDPENDEESGSNENVKDKDDPEGPPNKKMKTVLDIADKLDSNMEIIFQFFEKYESYQILLWKSFIKFIPVLLDVHKSKFIQFTFWYLVERDSHVERESPPLYREFISELMKIVYITISNEVTNVSDSTMISTASYLASFCARARFVDIDSIREALTCLLHWAIFYIRQKSHKRNKLFYSITQAIFYIMCYRGRQILHSQEKENPHYISSEKFHLLFSSEKLNPLHNCLSSIQQEFRVLGEEFGLIPINVLQNCSVSVRKKSSATKISTPGMNGFKKQLGGIRSQGKVSNPLRSFFPFDPYLLKRSSTRIVGYLSWDDVDDLHEEECKSYLVGDEDDMSEILLDPEQTSVSEEDNDGDDGNIDDKDDDSSIDDNFKDDSSEDDSDSIAEICSNKRWRKTSIASEGSW